jgi:hypothetical protein
MTNKLRPGEQWELDYTTLDVFLFDSTSRKRSPARPLVGIYIDPASGAIVRFELKDRKPQGNGK